MADESPTVLNAYRNKKTGKKGFLESDLPRTKIETITTSDPVSPVINTGPKVPYKMTLTEDNMGLAPELQTQMVGESRMTPPKERIVTKEQISDAAGEFPIAGPIPANLITEEKVDSAPQGPQVPFSAGQEGYTAEDVSTKPASEFKDNLTTKQQIIQNNFEREQLEKERELRRKIYGRAEGDIGPIETFFLDDDQRSTGERFVSKVSGLTGATIAGGARGAAFIPLVVDQVSQLGTWGLQNSFKAISGDETIPYNENWMANNPANQVTRFLLNSSNKIKQSFDVDNKSAAQSIIGLTTEFAVPLRTYKTPLEAGRALINFAGTLGKGMSLSEKVRTSWQAATASRAISYVPKIEVNVSNQYFAQKAKEAKKITLTEKFRLKQLEHRAQRANSDQIIKSTTLNKAQKNVALAELELSEAIAKVNVFEPVMAKFTPILKNQFMIRSTGPHIWQFELFAKEAKGLTGVVYKPNKKTGVMEPVQVTKKPTVEDVKRYRADQRNIHLQTSVGAGAFGGMWENQFQGTEYESFKYAAALGGGLFQPLMALRALTGITDAIQSTVQQTAIPARYVGLHKIYGTDQAAFGVGNILVLAAILNHNVKRYGLSNLPRTRFRTQDQIENPQNPFDRGLGIPDPIDATKVIFDNPYEKRLLMGVGGIPLTKAFLTDATKPIMRTELDPLTGKVKETDQPLFQSARNPEDPKYRPDLEPTAPENMIVATQLDLLAENVGYNVKRYSKVASDLMETLTPQEINGLLKLHADTAALHAKLLRMGKEDNFEHFQLTNEMATRAALAQLELNAFSPLMLDTKYRRNKIPIVGQFQGSPAQALTLEGEIVVELLRASLKETDVNISLISKRLARISDDPLLKKEFSSYIEKMENFKLNLKNNQQKLRDSLAPYNIGDDAVKNAQKVIEEMTLQKAIYASREEGGLGLSKKFNFHEDATTQGIALRTHGEGISDTIQGVRNILSEEAAIAFKYKNIDDPFNQVFKDTTVDGNSVLDVMQPLRNFEIDGKTLNLREVLGDNWVSLGIKQTTLIDDLSIYSRYIALKDLPTEELLTMVKSLGDSQVPVFLNRTKYSAEGMGKTIQGDTTGGFGLLDIPKILSKLDEYAAVHGQTLETGRREYLLRLLTFMEQKKKNVEWAGSPSHLDDLLGHEFAITDLLNISTALSSYGVKKQLTASGVHAFDITNATDAILKSAKVTDMTQEAKDLWVRTKDIGRVLQKDLQNQINKTGKLNTKEDYEFFDMFFTKPQDYVERFYNNLFKPVKRDGADLNLFKELKEKMNVHLSDHLGLRLVSDEQFRKNVFTEKGYARIEHLNKKGIIDDATFEFYKNYRKKHNEFPTLIGEYKKEFTDLTKLINRVVKEADDTFKNSSLFGEFKNIKDVDDLYDYFAGSSMNSLMAPKILSGEVIDETILNTIRTKFKGLNIKADDDFIQIVRKNPNLTSDQINEIVDLFIPVTVREAQTNRIDGFLEYVLGITPGKVITATDKANLQNLEKVLNASLGKRAVKTTNVRKSVFDSSPEESVAGPIVGNLSFGIRETVDIQEFARHFVNLKPFYEKIDKLTGNTVRQNDLEEVYKISVASLAKSTPALRTLQDILGAGPAGQLTLPAALGRGFSGIRGVVSWKYLAAEQIARQTNLGKQRMLLEMIGDPNLLNLLLKMGMNKKPNKEELEQFGKIVRRVATVAGARIVAYNEMKEEILNPTNEQLLKSFQREYDAFEFSKLASTVPVERIANPPRAKQPVTIGFADGVEGKTVLEEPLPKGVNQSDVDFLMEMRK